MKLRHAERIPLILHACRDKKEIQFSDEDLLRNLNELRLYNIKMIKINSNRFNLLLSKFKARI